jgi:hypothetical protein
VLSNYKYKVYWHNLNLTITECLHGTVKDKRAPKIVCDVCKKEKHLKEVPQNYFKRLNYVNV